jgi:hypothetical protein
MVSGLALGFVEKKSYSGHVVSSCRLMAQPNEKKNLCRKNGSGHHQCPVIT